MRIKLRNKLFEISCAIHRTIICTFNTSEYSVRWIKYSVLESHNKLWDFSDQEVANIARGGIVGWVQVRRICICFIFWLNLVEIFKFSQSMLVDCSNWLREISKKLWVLEVKFCIIAVKYPGKDWILREIVMRSITKNIQIIYILYVRNFPLGPFVADFTNIDGNQLDCLLF